MNSMAKFLQNFLDWIFAWLLPPGLFTSKVWIYFIENWMLMLLYPVSLVCLATGTLFSLQAADQLKDLLAILSLMQAGNGGEIIQISLLMAAQYAGSSACRWIASTCLTLLLQRGAWRFRHDLLLMTRRLKIGDFHWKEIEGPLGTDWTLWSAALVSTRDQLLRTFSVGGYLLILLRINTIFTLVFAAFILIQAAITAWLAKAGHADRLLIRKETSLVSRVLLRLTNSYAVWLDHQTNSFMTDNSLLTWFRWKSHIGKLYRVQVREGALTAAVGEINRWLGWLALPSTILACLWLADRHIVVPWLGPATSPLSALVLLSSFGAKLQTELPVMGATIHGLRSVAITLKDERGKPRGIATLLRLCQETVKPFARLRWLCKQLRQPTWGEAGEIQSPIYTSAASVSPGTLRISDLSVKGQDGKLILKNVSLQAKSGEVVVILGAHHAGKGTLLKAICGMIEGEGQIEFAELPIERYKNASSLRYLLQSRGTFFCEQETLRMKLSRGKNMNESRIWQVLDDVGVGESIRERGGLEIVPIGPHQAWQLLPHRERRLLGIAEAILNNIPLLLVEEAFGEDDTMSTLLERVAKDYQMTILYCKDGLRGLTPDQTVVLLEGRPAISKMGKLGELSNEESVQKMLEAIVTPLRPWRSHEMVSKLSIFDKPDNA